MNPPIQDDANYRKALQEIESLMHARAGTSEGERLEVIVAEVQTYERQHFPMHASEIPTN